MFDYAQAQLLGRATDDATIHYASDGRVVRAVFTIACNIPVRRGADLQKKTVFRRIMALGSLAAYVERCQADGGLKGRLINAVGSMDDEKYGEDDYREVIRVVHGDGALKIMDRRNDG